MLTDLNQLWNCGLQEARQADEGCQNAEHVQGGSQAAELRQCCAVCIATSHSACAEVTDLGAELPRGAQSLALH